MDLVSLLFSVLVILILAYAVSLALNYFGVPQGLKLIIGLFFLALIVIWLARQFSVATF